MAVTGRRDAQDVDLVDKSQTKVTRIRPRAIIFGLLLIPAIGFWLFEGEMARYTFTTWAAPFYNAIYVLFVITLLNMAIGKLVRWQPFNHLELLCLYVMISVASALLSTDLLGILITLMGYPARFATESNAWNTLFDGVLPNWLMVTDEAALKNFYEGNSTFYTAQHIYAWLKPSLYWMVFIAALFISFLSLSVLFRKHWADAERLTFPIVQLPMAMTESPKRFFSDRLMWMGILLAGGITLLNGIHYLFPTVPEIPIRRRDFPIFTTHPWNVINPIRISFYFFAITLGFLMPLDLSISCWVFYFIFLGERVGTASLGYEPASGVPFIDDQAFGAYIAIGLFAIWGMRRHLARAFKAAFMGEGKGTDHDEPVSYRTAYIALILSLLAMIIFSCKAGMTTGVAIFFIAILMAAAVVISRIRCELGFPVHDMHGMGSHSVMIRMMGPEHFTRPTLGAFTMLTWTGRAFRSHPMPHQLEGLKLAGNENRARRDMLIAILLAGLITIPICFWIYLDRFYTLGAATARVGIWGTMYGQEAFPRLEGWLNNPAHPMTERWFGMGAGGAIAFGLAIIRSRVIGFPLHPLGYAVANSWGMFNLWLPILIGSLCKAAVLKAGGLKSYRKATMFFFGLMLGEFIVGCTWTILGMVLGIRTYDFWP